MNIIMLKKILLGLLITCTDNICSITSASEVYNDIKHHNINYTRLIIESLYENISELLSDNTHKLDDNNLGHKVIKNYLNNILNVTQILLNKIECNTQYKDILEVINIYLDTINEFNILKTELSQNNSWNIKDIFIKDEKKIESETTIKKQNAILNTLKSQIIVLISLMLEDIEDKNNLKEFISKIYDDLKSSCSKSEKEYKIRKQLYIKVKIYKSEELYFKNCKTLYDVFCKYYIYNKIDKIASEKYNKSEDKVICNIDAKYLANNNNINKILDDIIQEINNKHKTKYNLYIGNLLYKYYDRIIKIQPLLYLSTRNDRVNDIINIINDIAPSCEFPLTIKDNDKLLKYKEQYYYTSDNSHFSKSYNSMYDFIVANFIRNRIETIISSKQSNPKNSAVCDIYDWQLNDDMKRILDDIIHEINKKHSKIYHKLYTIPDGLSDGNKIIHTLRLSEGNEPLIPFDYKVLLENTLPLTAQLNKELFIKYSELPCYSSDISSILNSCKSLYHLIIFYFIREKLRRDGESSQTIILMEFPDDSIEIIRHIEPVMNDIFNNGFYSNKYIWKIKDNKLIIVNEKKIDIRKLLKTPLWKITEEENENNSDV